MHFLPALENVWEAIRIVGMLWVWWEAGVEAHDARMGRARAKIEVFMVAGIFDGVAVYCVQSQSKGRFVLVVKTERKI